MATDTSNFNFQGIGIVNLVDGDSGGGGCIDQNASNYNPSATVDDGSCLYDEGGPGCTNPNAFNYNPAATSDDGSCVFDPGGGGCTDPLAVNHNPTADFDDGSCTYVQIPGCMDPLASNYDPFANVDDGSCEYLVEILGCIDPLACNYDPLANTDDGSCFYPDGCTDPTAPNYDPLADCDDGSCIYTGGDWGCTDVNACNYNSLATNNDGSCDYSCFGCTDNGQKSIANGDAIDSIYPGNTACNYDPFATVNDGTCFWNICCSDIRYLNGTPLDPDCCSFDNSYCEILSTPGCMDDGTIEDYICVMDPFALYDYTLPDGTVINADANGIIAAAGDPSAWPGAGNGDHPDFSYQSNCINTLYTNNGDGDPSAVGVGSFNPGAPATNYDPFATVDDGSCDYKPIVRVKGCLDVTACNYDCAADPITGDPTPGPCNDGVTQGANKFCIYENFCTDCDGKCKDGCILTNSDFCAVLYPGNDSDCCMPVMEGCMDATADNFNCLTGSTSTTPCGGSGPYNLDINTQDDPSSCVYTNIYGCTDPTATNYDPDATVDDGSCRYDNNGCTDPIACNYNPLADFDDGTCAYGPAGCTDPTASNYNSSVTDECDDGSCIYNNPDGCSDPQAINYDPLLAGTPVDSNICVYCGETCGNAISDFGYNDENGNFINNPTTSPMFKYRDSGYVGRNWDTGSVIPPGPLPTMSNPLECPAWDYLVGESFTDKFIGLYYGTRSTPYTLGATTSLCLANPADFNGEMRALRNVDMVSIYNYPKTPTQSDTQAYLASEVYSANAFETTIIDIIVWLNANVHNSFNDDMTYEEVNQHYKDKNPQIAWDDTGAFKVYPIKFRGSGIGCCEDC